MLYRKVVKRVNPKTSHHIQIFSYFFNFYVMMDIHEACCDNHLMICMNQIIMIIMLYILSLHTAVCQLYLNKTERKISSSHVRKVKKKKSVKLISSSRFYLNI